jgi:hypothetical protein
MMIGTLFTLFVTPAVYTFLAKDYQKAGARAAEAAPPSAPEPASAVAGSEMPAKAAGQEAQAEASALDKLVSESPKEEGHSAEVLAFSSAAVAASTGEDKGRKGRRPPKRKPLMPAAE